MTMIRVGILGADSSIAGELIRILVHHPEIELVTAFAPSLTGKSLSSLHKGIIGDTELRFTDVLDLEELNLLFVTKGFDPLTESTFIPEDLRIIVIQSSDEFDSNISLGTVDFVPGVSEMFRKPLVRGAKASRILPPATSVALILLYPLALHLLLNDSLEIEVSLPSFKASNFNPEGMSRELNNLLANVQFSFKGVKEISFKTSDTVRAVSVEATMDCKVSEEELERIYNEVYDDHNFTFLVRKEPSPEEVAGTHKCLIYINKPSEDKLKIKAIADSVLRGGAGDAIHAMNLLFGLFEKIGLSLPAGLAFNKET